MTNFAITVTQTSYFFEVRSQGCNKSRILSVLLHRLSQSKIYSNVAFSLPSFVLCMSSDDGGPNNTSIFQATAEAFKMKLEARKRKVVGGGGSGGSLGGGSVSGSASVGGESNVDGTSSPETASPLTMPYVVDNKSSNDALIGMKKLSLSSQGGVETGGGGGGSGGGGGGGSGGGGGLGMGGLASVGVFNCFYGSSKERDNLQIPYADFYIDVESDLRTLLRGIAKLSGSVKAEENHV